MQSFIYILVVKEDQKERYTHEASHSSLESLLPSIELLNEEAFASQKEVITEENKRHGPDDDTQNPK